ncbi:ribonuclease P protein subunit p21 isoform 1-T1 [Vipera latastei]
MLPCKIQSRSGKQPRVLKKKKDSLIWAFTADPLQSNNLCVKLAELVFSTGKTTGHAHLRRRGPPQAPFLFRTRTLPPCCSSIPWDEKALHFPEAFVPRNRKKKKMHSGSFERRTWRETLRAELRKPVLWHFNQLGPVQSQRPSLQTTWGYQVLSTVKSPSSCLLKKAVLLWRRRRKLVTRSHSMIKDKEAFQRLNFLYQAAHCVLAQNPDNQELARFYCQTQNNISRRLVLRQDPSVKRTICKSCFSLLVPGISSTVRQRKRRHQRWTVVQCLNCGLSKRFLSNPGYKLWSEQPESLLENQTPAAVGPKGQIPNPAQEPRKASKMGKTTVPSSNPCSHVASEENTAGTRSIGAKSGK